MDHDQALTTLDDLPAEAHVHIDALQKLIGIRIREGLITLSFDQDRARSIEVKLHRRIAGTARK